MASWTHTIDFAAETFLLVEMTMAQYGEPFVSQAISLKIPFRASKSSHGLVDVILISHKIFFVQHSSDLVVAYCCGDMWVDANPFLSKVT